MIKWMSLCWHLKKKKKKMKATDPYLKSKFKYAEYMKWFCNIG